MQQWGCVAAGSKPLHLLPFPVAAFRVVPSPLFHQDREMDQPGVIAVGVALTVAWLIGVAGIFVITPADPISFLIPAGLFTLIMLGVAVRLLRGPRNR